MCECYDGKSLFIARPIVATSPKIFCSAGIAQTESFVSWEAMMSGASSSGE